MNINSQQETAGPLTAEAALAGAGLLAAAKDGPLVLAQGGPWRIIWANDKAQQFFGTADTAELTRICLSGTEPGARQLSRLAEMTSPGSEPVDLRLRLRMGGALRMISLSCHRLVNARPYFAISPWGYLAPVATPVLPEAIVDVAGVDAMTSLVSEGAAALHMLGDVSTAQDSDAAHTRITDRRGNVRFLWRTDREGVLTSITGALCEVVGCDSEKLIGQDFRTVTAGLKVDRSGRLNDALLRQDTWSGIEALWPMANSNKVVPVVLGALPGFDRARAFDGFSGFGVIHLDRITDAPSVSQTHHSGEVVSVVPNGILPAASAFADQDITPVKDTQASTAMDEIIAENYASDEENQVPDITEAREALHPVSAGKSGNSSLAFNTDAADETDTNGSNGDTVAGAAGRVSESDAQNALTKTSIPADAIDTAQRSLTPGNDSAATHNAASSNVVPIRAWQKETRGTLAVSEAPNFIHPRQSDQATSISSQGQSTSDETQTPASGERRRVTDALDGRQAPAAPGQSDVAAGTGNHRDELVGLSPAERNAFREIARALGARTSEKPLTATSTGGRVAGETISESGVAAFSSGNGNPTGFTDVQGGENTTGTDDLDLSAAEALAPQPKADILDGASNTLRLIERLDCGLLVSRSGIPVFVNKTLLDMLGYSSIVEFHKAGGLDRMFRGRDPDALSRDADGGAIPVIANNGEVLALEGRFQTIEWDGKAATLMTFRKTQGVELAAQIRALELDLRQKETEARETHAILDTATDGVVLIDEDGRILNLSKSGQALFSYEQNEVAGEPFTILLARESHAPAMDYLGGLKSNGVKSVLNDGREISGRASQGGVIPLFMTLGRVGTSSPQRFCAVLRDLTQWKKVERDLSDAKRDAERASSLKSDFLAKISHEIRTPLNAILGFAEVIIDERFGPVGNERYKDYMKDIHSSGTHVLSLVNDLLDLSKIEAGKLDLDFGSVNANKIVNECVSLIQTMATRERVIIRLSLAPRLPNIVADERSLRQIILNILSNAVKFNEPGGQVIVSTALTDAGHAVIRIRDTGIGMNDKELEMALEPFRQIATSRQTTGTGLGLPLTKALVEANRASFTIKSRKGEGTLVEVAFPQTRVLAE